MTSITLPRATVEQVLEAWQTATYGHPSHHKATLLAMTALRAALAQQDGPVEPVAWIDALKDAFFEGFTSVVTYKDILLNSPEEAWENYKPPRAAPPQRKLVPLTDDEIESCRHQGYAHAGLNAPFHFFKAARVVEQASWEKNHG